MQDLFNIVWALPGLLGLVVGCLLRRRAAAYTDRGWLRHFALLGLIVCLLFPIVSISDDIGYFNYYFSRGQAPDGNLWVSGSRREKQLFLLTALHLFVYVPASVLTAFCLQTLLSRLAAIPPLLCASQAVAPVRLRAPPLSRTAAFEF